MLENVPEVSAELGSKHSLESQWESRRQGATGPPPLNGSMSM